MENTNTLFFKEKSIEMYFYESEMIEKITTKNSDIYIALVEKNPFSKKDELTISNYKNGIVISKRKTDLEKLTEITDMETILYKIEQNDKTENIIFYDDNMKIDKKDNKIWIIEIDNMNDLKESIKELIFKDDSMIKEIANNYIQKNQDINIGFEFNCNKTKEILFDFIIAEDDFKYTKFFNLKDDKYIIKY